MAIGMIGGVGMADAYMNKPQYDATASGMLSPAEAAKLGADELKEMKKAGKVECETCANRAYVDGSNDGGVSFKTPTKVDPNQAAAKVYSHEREHYYREGVKAEQDNREVVSNNIRLFSSICPECGRSYIAGGETTTVTKGRPEQNNPAQEDQDKKKDPAQGIIDMLA